MKKHLYALTLVLLISSASTFADQGNAPCGMCASYPYDPQPEGTGYVEGSGEDSAQSSCATCVYNRNAWMKDRCYGGGSASLDSSSFFGDSVFQFQLLCLRPNGTGLSYGTDLNTGKIKNLNFKWDYGFRLGGDFQFFSQGCDFGVYWTNFCGRGNGNSCDNEIRLLPTWGIGLDSEDLPLMETTTAKWRASLNIIDIEIGHGLIIGSHVQFRPHVGVRCLRLKQKYTIDSQSVFLNNVLLEISGDTNITMKNVYKGVGLRGGFDTECKLGLGGFSIYGSASGSLICGRFNVRQTIDTDLDLDLLGNDFFFEETYTQEQDLFSTNAIADLALGLKWTTTCGSVSDSALAIKFGWEEQLFFDINQFQPLPPVPGNPTRGNLGLQGWTLSLLFEF